MSSPSQPSGMSDPSITWVSAPASSDRATRWSFGSTILPPLLARRLLASSSRSCLAPAVADRVSLRLQEGVRHRAADQKVVDSRQQVLDQHDLVGDLRASHDRHHRMLRSRPAVRRVSEAPSRPETQSPAGSPEIAREPPPSKLRHGARCQRRRSHSSRQARPTAWRTQRHPSSRPC